MCPFASGRQIHQRDADLMVQPVGGDAFSGILEVAQIVERVEVADGGDAVLLEEFGVQVNHAAGLLP